MVLNTVQLAFNLVSVRVPSSRHAKFSLTFRAPQSVYALENIGVVISFVAPYAFYVAALSSERSLTLSLSQPAGRHDVPLHDRTAVCGSARRRWRGSFRS